MKKLVVAVVVGLLTGASFGNLLTNPEFDSGLTGWNEWGNGGIEVWNDPADPDADPSYTMKPSSWGGPDDFQGITQATSIGTIIPGDPYMLSASFYQDFTDGWNASYEVMKLEFFDSVGAPVGSVVTNLSSVPDRSWTTVSIQTIAPANSSYANVVFESDNATAGGVLQGDSFDLVATIPEPASALLFGLTGIGLVLLRNRRRA